MPCGSYIGTVPTAQDDVREVYGFPYYTVSGSGTCQTYSDTAAAAFVTDYDLDGWAWGSNVWAYFLADGTNIWTDSGPPGYLYSESYTPGRYNSFLDDTYPYCGRIQFFINVPVQYSIIEIAFPLTDPGDPTCTEAPIILQGCSGQTGGCGGDWIEVGLPALPPNSTCSSACPLGVYRYVSLNNPVKTITGVAPYPTLAAFAAAFASENGATMGAGWNKGACYGNHQDPFNDEDP
jgi:hypothetical protein